MPFSTQGFLSPELEKFRAALRGIPAYRAWFEFGDDLNRLGHEMLDWLDVPFDDNQRLTIVGVSRAITRGRVHARANFLAMKASRSNTYARTERRRIASMRFATASSASGAIWCARGGMSHRLNPTQTSHGD